MFDTPAQDSNPGSLNVSFRILIKSCTQRPRLIPRVSLNERDVAKLRSRFDLLLLIGT